MKNVARVCAIAFLSVPGLCQAQTANGVQTTQLPPLTPVFIKDDTAKYYFEQTIEGQLLIFPVEFDKENGVWKILEF